MIALAHGDIHGDIRFDVPLYSIAEMAWHLRMSDETLRRWVRRGDLVRSVRPDAPRSAELPFMAFVEAQFYLRLRDAGLTLPAIVAGMTEARAALGDDFLVEGRLAHDGRDILVNLADAGAKNEWMRARDHQHGLDRVIEYGLHPVRWGADRRPESMLVTSYEVPVTVDPRYGFGQPILDEYGVRVEDVAALLRAGDPVGVITRELAVSKQAVASIRRTHILAA